MVDPDSLKTTNFHSLDTDEVIELLDTDPKKGLAPEEAARRLATFGPNELRETKQRHWVIRFLAQFNDFMIWVLLVAVVISLVLPFIGDGAEGDFIDAIVIMAIVLLNAVLGFVQESRAESAMEELKKLSAPTASVVRDGVESTIPAKKLVPGDLILLDAGDAVSADARLVTSINLRADESSLTGESEAVNKRADVLIEPDDVIGDRENMVFTGTHIEYGRGSAIVAKTGTWTQMGKIAELLESGKDTITPLQKELRVVGRRIVYICIAVVLIVFVVGLLRGNPTATMLLFSVSLAVAAIPEGLPAMVTITLASGTRTMARQNAIIRNLPAVEALGSSDYICSDKTGTLTLNRMTVTNVLFADGSHLPLDDALRADDEYRSGSIRRMALVAALCNDARFGSDGELRGEATEAALLQAAAEAGADKTALLQKHPRFDEVPFDSERKMMTTVNRDGDSHLILTKGAPEAVLPRCTRAATALGDTELTEEMENRILEGTAELGSRALRTLAMASRRVGDGHLPSASSLEHELVFLGAFAMKDPPRPEVIGALEECRSANIKVAMVTGDHRATADAVARELHIMRPGSNLVEGKNLEKMDEQELASQSDDISVYARVAPHHKVKIVDAIKSRGHIVAMTGDGVNDAPALKRADIGVAMGIAGTDVSKEASDMVLADDNFATIVTAIRQGRVIFQNMKKFIYDLLSCNISEVLTMFLAMVAGLPLPLLPVQVLWINLVTDGLPALALGVDPPDKDVMRRPPRDPSENILSGRKLGRLLWQGGLITAGCLLSFLLARYLLGYDWSLAGAAGKANLEVARTILFTTMVMAQVLHTFNLRSETRSIFDQVPWGNRYLFGAFFISVGLQLAVLYVPFMQTAFHSAPLSASAWGLVIMCSLTPILLIDRIKVLIARSSAGAG